MININSDSLITHQTSIILIIWLIRMQCNLALVLVIASILHVFSPLAANIYILCSILGIMKYCAYLSLFSWMVSVSVDIYCVVQDSIKCIQDNPQRSISKQVFILFLIWHFIHPVRPFKWCSTNCEKTPCSLQIIWTFVLLFLYLN